MSIVITIVKFPENVSATKTTVTFGEQGGSIGRGPDNTWVLDDPERFISSQHCQIMCENGQYFLADTSTNGTFVNDAMEPVGKGNRVAVKDGDKFILGDYEFQISLWESDPAAASSAPVAGPFSEAAPAPAPAPSASDSGLFAAADPLASDPFAAPMGGVVSAGPLFSAEPQETDPLLALDRADQSFQPSPFADDIFSAGSHSDQADVLNQSVDWPDAFPEAGAIPEDWDLDADSGPSVAAGTAASPPPSVPPVAIPRPGADAAPAAGVDDRKIALEKANAKIQAEIEALKKQVQAAAMAPEVAVATPASKPVARDVTAGDKTLIEAMGLSDKNLSDEQVTEISQVVGELVRETITGMMQVLSSRSTIKNEFRMNITTIQPVENNPLKFSANVDDAMENMFIKQGNAYKKPVEAVREGFDGIAEHQIAILAGIRTAFKSVLERFDPETLENRFEKFNKSRLIPGSHKARNWDMYTEYYRELVDDMDNAFQHLFGYEFVQAYENQLQKLAIARKTRNS